MAEKITNTCLEGTYAFRVTASHEYGFGGNTTQHAGDHIEGKFGTVSASSAAALLGKNRLNHMQATGDFIGADGGQLSIVKVDKYREVKPEDKNDHLAQTDTGEIIIEQGTVVATMPDSYLMERTQGYYDQLLPMEIQYQLDKVYEP